MSENRLHDFLSHMLDAAQLACSYVDNMEKNDFFEDIRTQQAVIMNLIIIGEAATKIMELDSLFMAKHVEIPWRNMRGMRNRIAHGYFDINLDVVWETVRTALPELIAHLPAAQLDTLNRL